MPLDVVVWLPRVTSTGQLANINTTNCTVAEAGLSWGVMIVRQLAEEKVVKLVKLFFANLFAGLQGFHRHLASSHKMGIDMSKAFDPLLLSSCEEHSVFILFQCGTEGLTDADRAFGIGWLPITWGVVFRVGLTRRADSHQGGAFMLSIMGDDDDVSSNGPKLGFQNNAIEWTIGDAWVERLQVGNQQIAESIPSEIVPLLLEFVRKLDKLVGKTQGGDSSKLIFTCQMVFLNELVFTTTE